MTHPTDVDVLIIGAGPTGLTMACLLAQFGVKFRIIEKNKTITERSKALAVQARTLELFEQLGLTEAALEMGQPAEGLDLFVRGKMRASVDLRDYGKGMTNYPYILILEQSKTEKLLLEKMESLGGKVEWQKELVELTQHPAFVTAEVSSHEKLETIRAKYLVAADGARSTVRSLLQLPFMGGTYENRFLLADIMVRGPVSRRHISLCLSQRGFSGFFPMYGSERYRAIGLLPDWIQGQEEKEFEVIANEIRQQAELPLEITDPLWVSTYKLHHRNVLRFREQRCFFAGDAAHIHSPAGGQGMNTGIQDAFNLAWKISCVIKGRAKESLLDTYHEERHPIARKLIRSTDQVFSYVIDQRFLFRWSRLYVAPYIIKYLFKTKLFRGFIFRLVSQLGINYRHSSLVQQCFHSKGVLRAGDRFCDSRFQNGLFHACLIGGQEKQKEVVDILETYFEDKIKIHTLDQRSDLHSILQKYGIYKDGVLLIRPDGHVGFCGECLDVKSLERYLDRYFLIRDAPKEKFPDKKEGFPFESFI